MPSEVGLVARVEAIREKALGGARVKRSPYVEGVRTMNDSVTLMLDGDICAGTAAHLEALLEGLLQLQQPLHLIIDLSEVRSVSSGTLRMIDRYSTIRSDLDILGRTTLR